MRLGWAPLTCCHFSRQCNISFDVFLSVIVSKANTRPKWVPRVDFEYISFRSIWVNLHELSAVDVIGVLHACSHSGSSFLHPNAPAFSDYSFNSPETLTWYLNIAENSDPVSWKIPVDIAYLCSNFFVYLRVMNQVTSLYLVFLSTYLKKKLLLRVFALYAFVKSCFLERRRM